MRFMYAPPLAQKMQSYHLAVTPGVIACSYEFRGCLMNAICKLREALIEKFILPHPSSYTTDMNFKLPS